jgi:hypothetical protein
MNEEAIIRAGIEFHLSRVDGDRKFITALNIEIILNILRIHSFSIIDFWKNRIEIINW